MSLLELLQNDSCIYCNLFNYSTFHQRKPLQKAFYYKYLESELRGKHLNIATMQNGALSGAVKVNNTWVGKGVAFDLIQLLQELYNFEYTVIVPLENSLGSKDEGIFGLIYNEKVDLAAAFLPITTIYWKHVDFGTSLDMGEWIGVLKRPHESGAGSGIFAPFTLEVWFLIIASIFATGLVIFVILYSTITTKTKKSRSLQDCLLFVYGALLRQSSTLKSQSVSSRLAFVAWWLFVMLITAFYTANLTAFLTLSETKLPIKNSREIVTKKYSIIGKTGSIIEETTTNNLESLHNAFKVSQKLFVKEDDMFILNNWIKEQHFIYLAEKPNIDIVLYKNYLKYINTDTPQTESLRIFVEVGLVKHKFTKYLPVANYCPLNLHNQERPLSNVDYLITYYILIGGFLLSLFIFVLEIVVFILKKKVNNASKIKPALVMRYPIQLDFNPVRLKALRYSSKFQKKHINGRDYWIATFRGELRLVPIRTPSAMIFHATAEDMYK